jgi:hypothetical protein
MTAFTTIIETDIDPRSPITSALLVALRDNPLAISDGGATAPRIQAAALDQGSGVQAVTAATVRDQAATDEKFALGSVTAATLATDVSSKMVTNGYSHNHDGGDGAVIPYTGIQDGIGFVGGDVDKSSGTVGSLYMPNNTGWVADAPGWYNFATSGSGVRLRLNFSGVWVESGSPLRMGFLWSDGVNVTLAARNGAVTLEWQRMLT